MGLAVFLTIDNLIAWRIPAAAHRAGHVFLVQWECDPATAKRGDVTINREAGETSEAFERRAIDLFKPARGAAFVWIGSKAR